jgi:hypothetical protein
LLKSFLLAVTALVVLLLAWSPARGAELLANGGFEDGIDGWSATFGVLAPVGSPVHSGTRAVSLTSAGVQAHEVYQSAKVAPGEVYSFGGWVRMDNPNVERVFLRVSWFDSAGSLVSAEDSSWLTTGADFYRWLNIGPVTSPAAARTARVGIRVQSAGSFSVQLDDFSFEGAPAPPVTATASPTASPTLAATPINTPTPSPRPSTPSPETELLVFERLTNAGFEVMRQDGTPYGWRNVGAELSTVAVPRVEGERALAVTSRSSSTKWAYQTVRVMPGGWYEASAWTMAGGAAEAFLRLSWYESVDGNGAAIESVDSSESATRNAAEFVALSTGAVQAPANAQTVKVRLMMRPGSDGETTAYFDAVSLNQVDEPAPGEQIDEPRAAPASVRRLGSSLTSGHGPIPGTEGPDDELADLNATPFVFANVQPDRAPVAPIVSRDDRGYRWLAYVGLATGLAAFAYVGATELARRRRREGE